ncbi:MAG TPA: O-antigen ligase family protein [Thermoanaerobaculia bacterium]|nr:O-antigen ligase family protein [Thermoanaerobaculia bacterium]
MPYILFGSYVVAFIAAIQHRGLRGAFYFFCITFPFTFFVSIGPVNANSAELASFLALLVLVGALSRSGVGLTLRWPHIHYAPFFVYAAASLAILLTSAPTPRAIVFVVRPAAFLAVAVIGMQVVRSSQEAERIPRLVAIGVSAALGIGLIELLMVQDLSDVLAWKTVLSRMGVLPVTLEEQAILEWSYVEGLSGIFPLHHPYAYFLGVVWLFVFSRLLHSRPPGRESTAIHIGLLVILSILLLATQSRTFQLALLPAILAGVLVMPARRLFPRLGVVLMVAAGIGVVVAGSGMGIERWSATIALVTGDPSDAGDGSVVQRIEYQERSVELIRAHPWLGAGFDSYGAGFGQSKPHNAYLTEWQVKGVLGTAAYLLLIGVLFLSGWRGYRRGRQGAVYFHFAVVFSVYVGVAGFGTAFLGDVRAAMPLILAYVMIHALTRETRLSEVDEGGRAERLSGRPVG